MKTMKTTVTTMTMKTMAAALALVACGPGPKKAGDTIDAAGEPPIDASANLDGDFTPVPDSSCGAQQANIGVVNLGDPPDLLVVLDRSGSMNDAIVEFPPSFPPKIKWTVMKTALHDITTAKQTAIRFGLLDFPSTGSVMGCGADAAAEVPVGLNSAAGFDSYFAGHNPDGNTPAFVGLNAALAYYSTIPVNTAGRYVLFATDGLPNCKGAAPDGTGGDPNTRSDAETVAAVTALANSGIHTFVLGFGEFMNGDQVLQDSATAGLEPRAGSKKYYEANNAASLDAALAAIAGGIIVPSCSFSLASQPPVPNDVTVQLNGMTVPRSTQHTDGWDYAPNASTITFYGSYCDAIMMGASTNVSFAYGCPGPIIN